MGAVPLPRRPHVARADRARLLVYALFFLSGVAQSVIVPLLGRLSTVYGLTTSGTALVLALPGLATLIVSVPAGVAADRWGARRVTLAAGTVMCLSCAAQAMPSLAVLMIGGVTALVMAPLAVDRAGRRARRARGATEPATAASGATADGARPRAAPRGVEIATLLRSPRLAAAAGALIVAGAVSGVSQLLVSLQMRADGVSTGGIGLAFSDAAVAYIVVSAIIARMGERASTLRLNAVATALLSVALLPALAGGHPYALGGALLLAAVPRAAVNTIAYTLVAELATAGARGAMAFGVLNGAWAGALVLAPLLAGSLDQHAGPAAGYLAAIVPSGAIALWLVLRARREPSRAQLRACH